MIKYLTTSIATLLCVLASAQLAPSVWPKFRGNLANTGVGTGFSATNQVLWSQVISPTMGVLSSPVVGVDGTVYIGSASETCLFALNGKTGSILWAYGTSGAISGSAAVQQDGSVCFGSADGGIYCVNGATGKLIWSVATGGSVTGSPTVDSSGNVYIGSEDRKLYSINGASGKVNWTFSGGAQFQSTPAIGPDGTLYMGCNDGSLYALNPADGSIKWFFVAGGPIRGAPAIAANGTVIVGSVDQNIYGLRGSTGKVLWKFVTNGQVNASPAISASGTVVLGSADGSVYGLRAVDGARLWTLKTDGGIESSASFTNSGLTYIGSDDGFVYCLNPSGSVVWKFLTSSAVQSSPTPGADGTMYIGAQNGSIYAFETTYPGPRPVSLSISPTTISAGMPCQGTVTLDHPALYGGAVVKIAANQTFAEVPSSITVPYGQTTATFPIATSTTGTNSTVKITCSANGQATTASLTIGPPRLVSITISPAQVLGGTEALGTVTLSSTARAGGVVVSASSNSYAIIPPSAITVPSGQASTTFVIRTLGVSQVRSGKVTATSGGHSASASLMVTPASLASIQVQPASVPGGQSATGLITLNGPAPAGGAVVRVHATVSSAVVPAVVVVPAGKSSVTFTVKTVPVSTPQSVTISANYLTVQQVTSIGIQPPQLLSLSINPISIELGTSATATLTISSPAPAGGLLVKASSSSSGVTCPASISVPAGRTTVVFALKALRTGPTGAVTISVSYGGASISAQLTVNP